ncbi:MAG: cytochrome D1 domain-containing protein [Acidobacteriota bacterium]
MRTATKTIESRAHTALFAALLVAAWPWTAQGQSQTAAQRETATTVAEAQRSAHPVVDRTAREGLEIEFRATPSPDRSMTGEQIFAGDFVDLSFRITDASTGQPLKGQFPGAWMDIGESWDGDFALDTSCKDRVGIYLQGNIGIRPLIDLNSYFILVMNRDPSISVIDPITGITGITKLYAQINLESAGADWAKTEDEKMLFVSMPRAGRIAVVDTDTFQVIDNVGAGDNPTRIARQPDGQYLWIGNDTEDDASGVTVIETETLAVARRIATGRGHHEIAFSDDDRYAFVTNRGAGTVSVIDIRTLEKVKDLQTGPLPIAVDFSSHSGTLYVADGETGDITVIDGRTLDQAARIETRPGLGPVRISQDGRWALAVNTSADEAYVIDVATNRILHTLPTEDRPYQVAFSRSFAYIRSLGSERVSMIDLSELEGSGPPPMVRFAAGQEAPDRARDLSLAEAIVEAPGEAAVMVVSPADTTVYYYMEGMNAPMGNFRNYGHMPRAVQVIDRSMQERQPGVYSSTVRLPESGIYEVAFLMDSPSVLHCFELAARPNPMLEIKGPPLAVAYLDDKRHRDVGETVAMRFALSDRKTGKARTDLTDVSVHYFAAPGGKRSETAATHVGDGVYEASLTLAGAGAWYAYVACPSEGIRPADLPFTTFLAGVRRRQVPAATAHLQPRSLAP